MFDTAAMGAAREIPAHATALVTTAPVTTAPAAPRAGSAALRALGERVRPVALAGAQVLEVSGPLAAVVPDGLVRGASVAVVGPGATTVALRLVAEAARAGAWIAVVDLDDLGLLAALGAGIDPERLALVRIAGAPRRAEAIAALAGGVDLVLLDARVPLRAVEHRRLSARLRERGTTLVSVAPGHRSSSSVSWPVDLTLEVEGGRWSGIGRGHGSLTGRSLRVRARGRGRASRPRETVLDDG